MTNQPTAEEEGIVEMHTTEVFEANQHATDRIVLNEGGTRSSKTISIAQKYILKLQERDRRNWRGSIVRKAMPSLRATAMRDVIQLMKDYGFYREKNHNKTECSYRIEYKLDGKTYYKELEFFSADDEQKLRGRERDDLWMNEANELSHEEFLQLAFRTKGQITMDYNPVDDYHWIEEKVKQVRNDYVLIQSTYKDNAFLTDQTIAEIEALQQADENYWRVFGLGMKPISGTRIFTHWQLVNELPEDCDEYIYGVDFGFNNATAIIKIGIKDRAYYWKELFYRTQHTNAMLITAMHELVKDGEITYNMQGYGDTEDTNRIVEIQQAGFNLEKADKEGGSVKSGIDHIKSRPFYITKSSTNTLDNVKGYMWKTKGTQILEEPVKINDHALDAGRMAIWTHCGTGSVGEPRIRHI